MSSSWLYNFCTRLLPPQLALHWPLFAESSVCLLVSETFTVSLYLFHCWLPRNPLPRQLQLNWLGYTQVMWLGWSAGLATALWAKTYQVFFCFPLLSLLQEQNQLLFIVTFFCYPISQTLLLVLFLFVCFLFCLFFLVFF